MIMTLMSSPPLERWHGRFQSSLECQFGPWQGDNDVLFELTKSKRSQRGSCGAFIVRLMPEKNKHAPKSRTYDEGLLPPRLRILSPKTAASVCPVTFSFPLRLVLLVRPAQHRDHSFLFCFCFVRRKSCIPLCICFESVQAPRQDTRLFRRAVSICDV